MGKQRPKFRNAGKFVQTYTPKETVSYESKVVAEYKSQYNEPMFEVGDEIWATIIAYFKIPKSHYHYHKRTGTLDIDKEGQLMLDGKIKPMRKPDNDNIAKICLDALNGIAYPDDSQITILVVMKFWSDEPRVEVILEKATSRE